MKYTITLIGKEYKIEQILEYIDEQEGIDWEEDEEKEF